MMNGNRSKDACELPQPPLRRSRQTNRSPTSIYRVLGLSLFTIIAYYYGHRVSRPLQPAITSAVAIPAAKIEIDPTSATDLGWIPSGLPALHELTTSNPFAAPRTATGPLGRAKGKAFDWGNFEESVMQRFWREWMGDLYEHPIGAVPLPPHPYPVPITPPLYPEYYSIPPEKILSNLTFPPGFLFGWATAAQQYEGAVQADGRGPSIWDWVSRFPGLITDNTTSDVADLGYYLYKQDLARMSALGGNAYAFSVAWSRILPFGMSGTPLNEKGLKYYEELVAYCKEMGIEPVMTLFHWDTPLALQIEYGAFASSRIVYDFVNYAEVMFRRFNGTVTKWFTFNEPGVFCTDPGFPQNTTLPGTMTPSQYKYISRRHVVLAHAKAYRLFKKLSIQGEISYKNDDYLGVPWREGNEEDKEALERHAAYYIGFFADPIHLTGDWPETVKADLPPDVLPRFSTDEIEMIKGSADFFAIDGYREAWISAPSGGIAACRQNRSDPSWPECAIKKDYDSTSYSWGIGEFADPDVGWLHNSWQYIRPLLKRLSDRYPTLGGIYLTEFEFAEPLENEKQYLHQATQDPARTHLMLSYLGEVLKGVAEDGIPIKGVFAWSSVDNWEWNSGFKARFGSQYVDYNHPTLRRIFKRSALEMGRFWNAHRHEETRQG